MPSSPVDGCSPFDEQEDGIAKAIPLIPRGGCMFIDKVCLHDITLACVVYSLGRHWAGPRIEVN